MKVHVVRHAECYKNLVGVPGGEGASLTPTGVTQAHRVGAALQHRLANKATLVASPSRQTIETAAIIGRRLGIGSEVEPLFTSIDLGVLSGVPIKEARVRFPASSASMDQWRSHSSEIADLQIDGMESPWKFYNRGLQGVLKYRSCNELVICATTSIMILMSHMMSKVTPHSGEGYRSLSFTNTEIISLEFDDNHLDWFDRILEK